MTALPKIGKPATAALAAAGVTTLEQLAKHSEKELLALHGFGPKAIQLLTPALHKHGLSLRKD